VVREGARKRSVTCQAPVEVEGGDAEAGGEGEVEVAGVSVSQPTMKFRE
jgi:uncharacterized protein YpuA (DUF1002 family)